MNAERNQGARSTRAAIRRLIRNRSKQYLESGDKRASWVCDQIITDIGYYVERTQKRKGGVGRK
jgi:hypothetical protein